MFDVWSLTIQELVSVLSQWGKGCGYSIAVCMQVAVPRITVDECVAKIEVKGCVDW